VPRSREGRAGEGVPERGQIGVADVGGAG